MKNLLHKNSLLIFFGLIFISSPALGNKKTISAKDIKFITILAQRLNLKLQHSNTSNYSLKWTGNLNIQIEKEKLIARSKNFSSKKAWSDKNKAKSIDLTISGPSNNLQIFSMNSSNTISNWTQPVFISSFKSQIKAVNTKGPWQISLKEGAINMAKHKSSLNVKAFQANLKLSHSEGDFAFLLNEGQITVRKSKGSIHFTNDKSKIRLTQFKGSLKGFSRSGAVRASIQADSVDISTEEGNVRLYFVQQGPKVKAYTERGKIYAPRYFYKKFSGKSTRVSGNIKAKINKGSVSVKTDRGNIYLN